MEIVSLIYFCRNALFGNAALIDLCLSAQIHLRWWCCRFLLVTHLSKNDILRSTATASTTLIQNQIYVNKSNLIIPIFSTAQTFEWHVYNLSTAIEWARKFELEKVFARYRCRCRRRRFLRCTFEITCSFGFKSSKWIRFPLEMYTFQRVKKWMN